MDEDTLLACVLDERMDEWLLLVDGTLEDDVDDALHGAVTVTVTVFCGQLLQLSSARGTAAASPNREARIIFEYILPRGKKPLVNERIC